MSSGGSDVEVPDTVHLLGQCRHLVEVCGEQREGPDLLGNVSGRREGGFSQGRSNAI